MNRITPLKYLSVFTIPLLAYFSFSQKGWITYAPMIEAFVLVPFLELFFRPNSANLSADEEEVRKADPVYDVLVYLVVPVQFALLGMYLFSLGDQSLTTFDLIGRIAAMGLLCGVIGINVAHELGHRTTWYERAMAKSLLLTSLYMHFYIEHNRGHHRNVSTDDDPSSARYGESLYAFWLRSVVFSYFSAWRLERDRLKKKGVRAFSFQNEMIRFQLIQLMLLGVIYFFFGGFVLSCFCLSASMGFLLLETVNYIEHYGLRREKRDNGYERVMPAHSWNSDHIIGRLMLFELSRHSDHHYIASRKYQVLRHMDESPQMPTGYPGMMLMATVPPVWFSVMNKRIRRAQY